MYIYIYIYIYMRCNSFLKAMFRESNNTINCDDNNDAICLLTLGCLLLLGTP